MRWIGFTGLATARRCCRAELHERKFLELARALAARPKLLLLDEVLSGLNPTEIDNAIRLVRAIRAQGATIVFVEHLMRAVVELSDRIAVLNEGKLFALGAPREVMRDPASSASTCGLRCLRRATCTSATRCDLPCGTSRSTSARARSCR
jgi:branched-chain amino acid transport system permease protein